MDFRELEETAQLARLNIGRDELSAALPAFERMLGFFAAMRRYKPGEGEGASSGGPGPAGGAPDGSAPAGGGRPPGSGEDGAAAGARLVGADHFHPDAVPAEDDGGPVQDPELNERILRGAGERDGRFIVIPNVL
ncbi:MAG: aspartyl/glutamyl-tRNA amidotransferase subunit C [Treponema sp.]|jgi:aspartyl-tRNA(Asn)/glutamyl-tRNA(Gln) amidotransferase subunit C|nr:aspartyl/glutamyl-tRNA amidotransferase subunit C [Treponema sp.]